MALTYNKAIRDLSIKGQITFNDGSTEWLYADDIVSYSFDQQIGSEGLPLGSAEAASFNMSISNVGRRFTPSKFDNAEVHMFAGIKTNSDYVWSDFGVWYVDSSEASEQSVTITISGFDALANRFEAIYIDEGQYPTSIGSLAQRLCAAAGITLARTNFPNAALSISRKPEWPEETTLRDILSYIAIAAAGYARINRNGKLDIVGFNEGNEYTLDSGLYTSFSLTGGKAFKFNCLEVMLNSEDEDYSKFAVDGNVTSDATNTIQLDWNPLITSNICNSIVNSLKGMEMTAASISWGGDPSAMCSDWYNIIDMNGATTRMMITSQSYSFDGGMSVTETCEMPAINTTSSATYSTSSNMYDAKGNVRATHISGLDRSVITATTGHFNDLTAENIGTDKLITAYVSALELAAKTIDTTTVTTSKLTSTVAAIVEATIQKVSAGVVDSDELYTSLAEIIALKVRSLKAEDIETETLAAALAAFTVITAGTAEFDKATIRHLVSEAMNLEFGAANQVFIKNLAVEYAQMVSASVGSLCIKASDGNYYLLDVDGNGNVSATLTTVSDGEINAGQTESGKVILETSITAESLNASNLLATYALINKIDAARIDADQLFAREAFVDKLVTSTIFANGGTLQMVAESTEETADGLAGVSSKLEQTEDRFELELSRKVGEDTLKQYLRYEDGTVEMGSSDSRYKLQASNTGVVILQDGSPMTRMEQNTVAAPVFEAGRMLKIGNHVAKTSASGALIFN